MPPPSPSAPVCWWTHFPPSLEIRSRMEQVGPGAPLCAPVSSSQQRLLRRSSTYLAKIAVVLQLAPEKMLTFTQVGVGWGGGWLGGGQVDPGLT